MKKVYIIMDDFGPVFVFSSRRTASKQMSVILEELQNKRWFVKAEDNDDHEVRYTESDPKRGLLRIVYKRRSADELHSYRLIEKEINSGYKIN